tara:strand:- start:600 stop:878 length:279 start_codon:yes stop_codon:yes gene_type:complete
MSVDGQAEWIENKADQIFQELKNKKKEQRASERVDDLTLWEQALERAALKYQNTDYDYDYVEEEEKEEEVSERADNLNAVNSNNFVNYKEKI